MLKSAFGVDGTQATSHLKIMDDDEPPLCPHCGTHFANRETLCKHIAAIHKKEAPPVPESSSKKRPLPEEEAAPSENVELAPLLGVLSDEQKDALILRAVQADPEFYERILEQASALLTEEAAEARLSALDSEGIIAAVRWFVTIGVPANALTLLAAASQSCLGALDDLAENISEGSTGAASSAAEAQAANEDDDEEEGEKQPSRREELLAKVEALPAVGAVGALWVELLGKAAVARRLRTASPEQVEAIQMLLEGMQAAAATVRPVVPGVLIGARGETIDSIGDGLAKLNAVLGFESAAAAKVSGKAKVPRK